MRRRPGIPHPYKAGLHYQREPICRYCEEWRDVLQVLAKRGGDCEDLAAYLAAWWRIRGVDALPFVKDPRLTSEGVLLYHIQVQMPDGRILDPSRVLGMGGPLDGVAPVTASRAGWRGRLGA